MTRLTGGPRAVGLHSPMSRTAGLPGPRRPRFLQGLRFLLTEHRMLERYRRRYGDLFALDVWPFTPLVVVSDPGEVRRIFTGAPKVLHAGEGNGILRPLVGSHSVLLLDEDEHLRRRRLLLPPFHGERMRVYGEVMREVAATEVAGWPHGRAFALQPAMQRITLRIILRTVFGMAEGPRAARLERDLVALLDRSNVMMMAKLQRDLGARSPWARFLRARETVDAQLFEEISRRRRALAEGGEGEDVLSMLIAAGQHATDAELRDDLMTLLVAGHETTATTMAWTLERLLRHPEALDPHAFRPERWLGGRKVDTYAWIPFGGGVRRCLGAAFATYEMREVLRTVLERAELRTAEPGRAERHRRKMITFVPDRGARAVMA